MRVSVTLIATFLTTISVQAQVVYGRVYDYGVGYNVSAGNVLYQNMMNTDSNGYASITDSRSGIYLNNPLVQSYNYSFSSIGLDANSFIRMNTYGYGQATTTDLVPVSSMTGAAWNDSIHIANYLQNTVKITMQITGKLFTPNTGPYVNFAQISAATINGSFTLPGIAFATADTGGFGHTITMNRGSFTLGSGFIAFSGDPASGFSATYVDTLTRTSASVDFNYGMLFHAAISTQFTNASNAPTIDLAHTISIVGLSDANDNSIPVSAITFGSGLSLASVPEPQSVIVISTAILMLLAITWRRLMSARCPEH